MKAREKQAIKRISASGVGRNVKARQTTAKLPGVWAEELRKLEGSTFLNLESAVFELAKVVAAKIGMPDEQISVFCEHLQLLVSTDPELESSIRSCVRIAGSTE